MDCNLKRTVWVDKRLYLKIKGHIEGFDRAQELNSLTGSQLIS